MAAAGVNLARRPGCRVAAGAAWAEQPRPDLRSRPGSKTSFRSIMVRFRIGFASMISIGPNTAALVALAQVQIIWSEMPRA